MPKFMARIKKIYRTLDEFFTRVDEHHIYMLASGLSFNIFLYVIPLFLIAVYLLKFFLGIEGITSIVYDLSDKFLPPTQQSRVIVDTIVKEVKGILEVSSVLGVVGLFGLLWLSSTLISSFRTALNNIFGLKSPYVFLLYRLKDIGLTIFLTALILLYSFVLPLISLVYSFFDDNTDGILGTVIDQLILTGGTIVSGFCLFYFIYRFVPNQRMERLPRMIATLAAVFSIELSRHFFAWYVNNIANYSKFYGTYAVLISVAIWIYYSSLIMLLSAELGKFVFDRKSIRMQKEERKQDVHELN